MSFFAITFELTKGAKIAKSYLMITMTHPSRNFFVISLLFVFTHICTTKSAGL